MKLAKEILETLNEENPEGDTYTGMINRTDNGWELKIDSIEFLNDFTEDQIKDVLNNTLAPGNKCDFANDGEKYVFDVNKFDNYVIDDFKKWQN